MKRFVLQENAFARQVTPVLMAAIWLYELIWKRTVASQMAEARLTMMSVDLSVGEAKFRSNGKRIDFPGFFQGLRRRQ